MSLIGDALRKARQEAAERDNERKGVLFSARIADTPTRSNLGLGIALGAIIAIVATIAGGAAVWWVLGGADQDPSIDTPVSEAVAETVAVAVTETEAEAEAGTGSGSGSGSADTATDTDTATATDTATVTATATVTDTATDTAPAPAADAATEPETGFLGTEDGAEIYLMEADVGNVTLSLDYIVFREPDPYAEINGTEVHVGGTIEGFRVKAIGRDRVVLSDGRHTIVLRTP